MNVLYTVLQPFFHREFEHDSYLDYTALEGNLLVGCPAPISLQLPIIPTDVFRSFPPSLQTKAGIACNNRVFPIPNLTTISDHVTISFDIFSILSF